MVRSVSSLSLLAALVFFIGSSYDAQAQASLFGIGPKAGFYLKGDPMIGVTTEFPITNNWIAEPALEVVFLNSSTIRFTADANVRYAFDIAGETFAPFVMAGAGLAFDRSTNGGTTKWDTDFRLNLGGGLWLNTRSTLQYWVGMKIYTLTSEDSDVALQGGLVFYL